MSIKNIIPRYPFLFLFIPGLLAFYNKKPYKGLAFIIILLFLFFLGINPDYSEDNIFIFFILLLFYLYQIIDNFDNLRTLRYDSQNILVNRKNESVSIYWAFFVFIIGIVFQLANFDVFSYAHVLKYWPVLFVFFGFKIVLNFFKRNNV